MPQFTPEQIHEMFVYHTPTTEAVKLHTNINGGTEALAQLFNSHLPQSAETTMAIRKLQEARMWANSAVALHVTHAQRLLGEEYDDDGVEWNPNLSVGDLKATLEAPRLQPEERCSHCELILHEADGDRVESAREYYLIGRRHMPGCHVVTGHVQPGSAALECGSVYKVPGADERFVRCTLPGDGHEIHRWPVWPDTGSGLNIPEQTWTNAEARPNRV